MIDVTPSMDLQAAIDGAAEGSVLLIRPRSPVASPVAIAGKSLVLQAREPLVGLLGGLTVSNLSAGQSVRLHGLWVRAHPSSLVLRDNQGLVWIESCVVDGASGGDALLAESCPDVVLLRSWVRGGDATGGRGGDGLETRGLATSVHAYGCTFEGGTAQMDFGGDDPDGGTAIVLGNPADFLFLSGGTIQGGNSAICGAPICDPGRGGDGVEAEGTVWLHDSQVLAGENIGTPGFACWSCSHLSGQAEVGKEIHHLPGRALSVSVASPVKEGESLELQITGRRGAPVWMAVAPRPDAIQAIANLGGTILLPIVPVPETTFLGFTDRGGRLERTLPAVALDPGVEALPVFLQFFTLELDSLPRPTALVEGPEHHLRGGRWQLGAGTMVVQLDESF